MLALLAKAIVTPAQYHVNETIYYVSQVSKVRPQNNIEKQADAGLHP